jgi:hypothetical protein
MEINQTEGDSVIEDKIVQLDREIQARLNKPGNQRGALNLAARNSLYRQYREWCQTGVQSPAIRKIAREI